MEKIIVVVDLGHFKAYKVTKEPLESTRTKLIKSYDAIDAHGKLSEKLSDNAGRFGIGKGKNGAAKGYGEPHNLHLEIEKKLIKTIAQDINELIKKEKLPQWYLAAVRKINKQVVELLNAAVRAKLEKNITADLTKTHKSEILGFFK
jgi:hypothetical protein